MIEVRPLHPGDDRSHFYSGNPDLDRFFQRYAGQNQFKHHIGTTYVAMENDRILGFVTVSASQIEIEQLPPERQQRLPQYPLPVLRLARLAVAETVQGQGIGLMLLRAVLQLALTMSETIGCIGVVVDAKPEAVNFYRRYGFEEMDVVQGLLGDRPQPLPMFLPLAAIPRS